MNTYFVYMTLGFALYMTVSYTGANGNIVQLGQIAAVVAQSGNPSGNIGSRSCNTSKHCKRMVCS
jgi:hypothetical protein